MHDGKNHSADFELNATGRVRTWAPEPRRAGPRNHGRSTFTAFAVLGAMLGTMACAGSTTPPVAKQETPSSRAPEPPSGPTRTDFNEIAKALVKRCVAGGWISKWRSTNENVDQAKPRILLNDFEDRTGQDLDPTYLRTTLEKRMRMSGVFDMVNDEASADFHGKGTLLRMSERNARGDRFSVYTVTLELKEPATGQNAYSCEATVKGDM